MSITVGIYDDHHLTGLGIQTLLKDVHDIQIAFNCHEKSSFDRFIKQSPANIILVNIHDLVPSVTVLFQQIKWSNSRSRILVISAINTEELVLNIIKAGANGFLSREANKSELLEAIYTLRNGHDYFSKSITHMLLNRYIGKIKENNNLVQRVDISSLSSRQVEILRLWGESFTNQEIADKLFISIRTVESHKNHIMQKLNLKSTVDMVKFAIKNNLIKI